MNITNIINYIIIIQKKQINVNKINTKRFQDNKNTNGNTDYY